MKLYSYCLRYDDGAAPNPFWGICTLVICKPKIRKAAKIGDWIIGLGSANSPIGDVSDCVIYAMKVTNKMTMEAYDKFCQTSYPKKIPNWRSKDHRRCVGDCIYDFSHGAPPRMRAGVHHERNRERYLSGGYALISDHFFYFGIKPLKLCDSLMPIIHDTQGHKSTVNDPYAREFVAWIENQDYEQNRLYGEPQLKLDFGSDSEARNQCAKRDLEDDQC